MSVQDQTEQINQLLQPIRHFLQCETPQAWLDAAAQPSALPTLLVDHLHCELKAAQSAALLLRRYVLDAESGAKVLQWLLPYEDALYRKQKVDLRALNANIPRLKTATCSVWQARMLDRMVLLMKEELHHFCQVFELLQARQLPLVAVSASRYAAGLLRHARTHEPLALVDKLIIGALIEARSCERFAALAPYLDQELQRFYLSLLRSEARHFEDYLALAELVFAAPISDRVQYLAAVEAELIGREDHELRFHSGVPLRSVNAFG